MALAVANERKELFVTNIPASGLMKVAWRTGGEVPVALSGSYTNAAKALEAISLWQIANPREPLAAVVVDAAPAPSDVETFTLANKGKKRASSND